MIPYLERHRLPVRGGWPAFDYVWRVGFTVRASSINLGRSPASGGARNNIVEMNCCPRMICGAWQYSHCPAALVSTCFTNKGTLWSPLGVPSFSRRVQYPSHLKPVGNGA